MNEDLYERQTQTIRTSNCRNRSHHIIADRFGTFQRSQFLLPFANFTTGKRNFMSTINSATMLSNIIVHAVNNEAPLNWHNNRPVNGGKQTTLAGTPVSLCPAIRPDSSSDGSGNFLTEKYVQLGRWVWVFLDVGRRKLPPADGHRLSPPLENPAPDQEFLYERLLVAAQVWCRRRAGQVGSEYPALDTLTDVEHVDRLQRCRLRGCLSPTADVGRRPALAAVMENWLETLNIYIPTYTHSDG